MSLPFQMGRPTVENKEIYNMLDFIDSREIHISHFHSDPWLRF